MTAEYVHTEEFRGATFRNADLTGATFRECDLTGVRIIGSEVKHLQISGFDGVAGTVVVDDVDVTAFVAAELDARYPERVQLRGMRTADDHRAMWDTLEHLWAETVARAERLPQSALDERVAGEWSFVETLRHLVFATDGWVGRMVLQQPAPYHRLALPPTDHPLEHAPDLGVDLDARPSYAEVLAVYADRRALIRRVLTDLTDSDLDQVRTGELAPVWGPESRPVAHCLGVLLREHCEHRRFADRDLAVLEVRRPR
jgi:hypothetical protein